MTQLFFRTLVGMLILVNFSQTLSAQLTVSANRNQFSPRDNIILKVETTKPLDIGLDLRSLQRQFLIIDQKKMTINSYAEGKRSSIVRWDVILRARISGQLQIPSLEYNQDSSEAFSIFVKSTDRSRFLPVSDLPIILDAQLNSDDNYENALFLYNLNIYSDRPLNNQYEISTPKINKADIQLLDQTAIQQVEIRGKQYNVIEQRYAIYPREMGRFIIEGPVFNGAQQDGPKVQIRANNLEINVRARQDFENAKYWLPATNVTIDETWQKPSPLRVGDIIPRQITLTAQGIAAKDLPDIITNAPEIVDILNTDVSLTDKINKQGIQGTRVEQQQIQLLERGEVTFPDIKIHWWDTTKDNQQISQINKQMLQVLAGENGESSIEREIAQNISVDEKSTPITIIETNSSWLVWLLIGFVLLTTLGWVFNIRKMKRIQDQQQEGFTTVTSISAKDESTFVDSNETILTHAKAKANFSAKAELNTFQQLGRACLKNDLIAAQRRLLEWANHFWYEQQLNEINDVAAAANDPSLNVLLLEMQELMETYNAQHWQGKNLFNLLTDIRSK
jgi:hypothetical protein